MLSIWKKESLSKSKYKFLPPIIIMFFLSVFAASHSMKYLSKNPGDFMNELYESENKHQNLSECSLRQFECKNGHCILLQWLCDEEDDCGDNSDENTTQCDPKNTCKEKEFWCTSGYCIPISWLCDREIDCQTGSDENPEMCNINECKADYFQCKTGPEECIPLSWMCDNSPDCKDGSDESFCPSSCKSNEFTCNNGNCVHNDLRCDMDDDCGDGTDEKNCPKRKCMANDFQCSDKSCILDKWRCDGDLDCPDRSDEKDCPNNPKSNIICYPGEFSCPDRITCIHPLEVCNGFEDCPDGADELPNQCLKNNTCFLDQFSCRNNECISKHLICNGINECFDGSDEEKCFEIIPACKEDEFNCDNNMCIPMNNICDGVSECPSEKDKCNTNECSNKNGGCVHICIDLPIGHRCDCHRGYRLVNKFQCDDINECEDLAVCSHICINLNGTFKCECKDGYSQDPTDKTCRAAPPEATLILSRRKDIIQISFSSKEMITIINDTESATVLDYESKGGLIFWCDSFDRKIYKANMTETGNTTEVIGNDILMCDGLAIDWVYRHIYWTDVGKSTIEVADYNGTMRKVLINENLDVPRAIVVNPLEGWMYWSDWGKDGRIERAGLDGSYRNTIISDYIEWPNGLALDLIKGRLYWVDAKLNSLSSVNHDGSRRTTVLRLSQAIRHPFSISVFEDTIYWTDWDNESIFKANKFNGSNITEIAKVITPLHPMGVQVFHPLRQPEGTNYCEKTCHDSQLCLPAPQIDSKSPKVSCVCPDGINCTQENEPKTNISHILIQNKTVSEIEDVNEINVINIIKCSKENISSVTICIFVSVITILSVCILLLVRKKYLRGNIERINFDDAPNQTKETTSFLDTSTFYFNHLCTSTTTVGEFNSTVI